MWLAFLYEVGLWCILLASLPRLLYQLIFRGKYRESFRQRFGGAIPHIVKSGRPLVWIHAVSLGETKGVAMLARRIKEEMRHSILVISSGTETGHAEAKRRIPSADCHLYLPFDFRPVVKRLFRRISPDLVIVMETDFWMNFLTEAKNSGARLVVVNGKMSERSARRYRLLPSYSTRLFSLFDLICVQSVEYAHCYQRSGASKDRIRVIGNLKFDETPVSLSQEELRRWKNELGILDGQPIVTVGSTHDPEEKEILQAFEEIWRHIPGCQLIMAPRHPERFREVAVLLEKRGISYRSYSQRREQQGQKQVVLIDAMGLLRCCYQLADIAIVAGSYTAKVGGHNILEPCIYGVPVLFGPHMTSQTELRNLVIQYGAGYEVDKQRLAQEVLALLSDSEKRRTLGQAGRKLMQTNAGATAQTWSLIRELYTNAFKSWPAERAKNSGL